MEKELFQKLRDASLGKDLVEMEKLLKEGANPNFPEAIDNPLLFEVLSGSSKEEEIFEVVSMLLKYKANVKGRFFQEGCRRDTIITNVSRCMEICKSSGSWRLLDLFLQHGEDPNRILKDLYDGRRVTIIISWNYLHDAIKVYGSYEMTEILLRNGADPNSFYNYREDSKFEKLTPLHLALKIGSILLPKALVNELIFSFYLSCRRFLVIDIYKIIFEKLSQLGDHLLIRILLEYGANVNEYGTIGNKTFTPFHDAIQKNNVYAVKAFLAKGADPNLEMTDNALKYNGYALAKLANDEITALVPAPKVVIPKKANREGPVPNFAKK